MKKIILYLSISIALTSCASIGSKTLYNSNKIEIKEVESIYAYQPEQVNFEYYNNSTIEQYFHEIAIQFNEYGIEIVRGDSLNISYDEIIPSSNQTLGVQIADLILLCKIKRNTAMGITTDFKTDYKVLDAKSNEILYESSTVVKTTVGFPSEEKLVRDAIRDGLYRFKKDYLEKK